MDSEYIEPKSLDASSKKSIAYFVIDYPSDGDYSGGP
jgi:hypothetical protein